MVVDLAAAHRRRPLVEQADQRADQAGLALAAFAEQYDVVAGQECALDLRQDRAVEADDARESVRPLAQTSEQVVTDLSFDRLVLVTGSTEFGERSDCRRARGCHQADHATTHPVGGEIRRVAGDWSTEV